MATAPKPSGENWSRAAKAYDSVLDVTDAFNPAGAACRQILNVVDNVLPFDQASYIIDMGTGSGAVISSLLDSPSHAAQIPDNARIVAADVAQGLLDILVEKKAAQAEESSVWKRLETMNWDARNLQNEIQDGEVSHLLSSYAYFAFAGEQEALSEAYRILKPGGLFIETSMGFTEWGHLPSFFQTVRPDKAIPGPGKHWQNVGGVKATLKGAGFKDVQAREYEIGIPVETHEGAVEMVFQIFPWVKGFITDMSEAEVTEAREKMVQFLREKHPEAPFVLNGTALIGWARK